MMKTTGSQQAIVAIVAGAVTVAIKEKKNAEWLNPIQHFLFKYMILPACEGEYFFLPLQA